MNKYINRYKMVWDYTFGEKSTLNLFGKIVVGPMTFVLAVLGITFVNAFDLIFEKSEKE